MNRREGLGGAGRPGRQRTIFGLGSRGAILRGDWLSILIDCGSAVASRGAAGLARTLSCLIFLFLPACNSGTPQFGSTQGAPHEVYPAMGPVEGLIGRVGFGGGENGEGRWARDIRCTVDVIYSVDDHFDPFFVQIGQDALRLYSGATDTGIDVPPGGALSRSLERYFDSLNGESLVLDLRSGGADPNASIALIRVVGEDFVQVVLCPVTGLHVSPPTDGEAWKGEFRNNVFKFIADIIDSGDFGLRTPPSFMQ